MSKDKSSEGWPNNESKKESASMNFYDDETLDELK